MLDFTNKNGEIVCKISGIWDKNAVAKINYALTPNTLNFSFKQENFADKFAKIFSLKKEKFTQIFGFKFSLKKYKFTQKNAINLNSQNAINLNSQNEQNKLAKNSANSTQNKFTQNPTNSSSPNDIKIKFTQFMPKKISFDFADLVSIDTAGICFFLALESDLKKLGFEISRLNLNSANAALFTLCEKNYTRFGKEIKQKKENYFVRTGRAIAKGLDALKHFIAFTGLVFWAMFKSLKHPSTIRFVAFLYHVEHSALKAMPIIVLTSLLVGVVLAYQAAYQLAQFGANIYIVDLVGISATRELAPLIAAIVIAGRSASSYTAQIGVMKITDEINAMNTMGFNSARFIIIPRVMGLCFAMPLIVAVADMVSIGGGMLVANLSLDINYVEFMRRFKEAVALKHVIIGLAKAPVFGFLIGLIACFRGFGVKNTTESIGIYTTKSVVNAIFWVIAFDAIFSIFLTQAGI